MRLVPRFLILALLPALSLVGCAEDDGAAVEIPAAPSAIGEPDLLGYWTVLEIDGAVPQGGAEIRYQFTPEGDFIRFEGSEVERSRYTFAGPDQLTVDGPTGTMFYDYALDGDELTLGEPGEGGEAIVLQKVADVDLGEVRPPSTAVPEEDSLPPDSM